MLARVNDEAIDLDLIKNEFEARHMGHMSMIGEQETLDTFLQSAIRRRLFVQEARRLGLQNDPDLRAAADVRRVELLADWLYKMTEVIGKVVVSEAAIDKAVAAQRSWREIVLIQTDTESQAIDARTRIQGNATPQDVARQLSKARSASRGGLEPVAWGDKEPALETAIFASKPGDLTPPVRVEEGWALAKVLAERKTEGIPDAQMRLKAKNVLEARARDTRRAAYLERLRVRYKATVVESLLEPDTLLPSLEVPPTHPQSAHHPHLRSQLWSNYPRPHRPNSALATPIALADFGGRTCGITTDTSDFHLMPRVARIAPGGLVFHVLNRANGRAPIFKKPADYGAFERVLVRTVEDVAMRILSYSVLPNHWHLVLWPYEDRDVAAFMQRLTTTHVRRWHLHRHTVGHGHAYQGPFTAFPVQTDEHLLTVCR